MIARDDKVSRLLKSKGVLDLCSTWATSLLPAAIADGKFFLIHFFSFFSFFVLIDLVGLLETRFFAGSFVFGINELGSGC